MHQAKKAHVQHQLLTYPVEEELGHDGADHAGRVDHCPRRRSLRALKLAAPLGHPKPPRGPLHDHDKDDLRRVLVVDGAARRAHALDLIVPYLLQVLLRARVAIHDQSRGPAAGAFRELDDVSAHRTLHQRERDHLLVHSLLLHNAAEHGSVQVPRPDDA